MKFVSENQRKKVMRELNPSGGRKNIDDNNDLDVIKGKFFDLLKEGKIDEASKLQEKMLNLKYDTTKLKGEMIFKVKVHNIIGGERVVTYRLSPKPSELGFDYWRDSKKITKGNRYLMAGSFEEAKKQLLVPGEYEFDRVEI